MTIKRAVFTTFVFLLGGGVGGLLVAGIWLQSERAKQFKTIDSVGVDIVPPNSVQGGVSAEKIRTLLENRSTQRPPVLSPDDITQISIQADDAIYLDTTLTPLSQIPSSILAKYGTTKRKVFVRAIRPASISSSTLRNLLTALSSSGLSQVSLVIDLDNPASADLLKRASLPCDAAKSEQLCIPMGCSWRTTPKPACVKMVE